MSTTSEMPVGGLALTGLGLTTAVRVGSQTKTWKFVSAGYRTSNLAALSWSDVSTAIAGISAATQSAIVAALKSNDVATAGRLLHDAVIASLRATAETQTAALVASDSFSMTDLEALF